MRAPRLIRAVLVVLAVPNVVTGAWAVFFPRSWYDDFPGWAPHLVAALPPFNEHLATDAGAGLLATGVAAAVAAVVLRRDAVLVASITYLAFALPHAVFHLAHPADALSTAEDAGNAGVLVAAAVLAALVLVLATLPPTAGEGSRGRARSTPQ